MAHLPIGTEISYKELIKMFENGNNNCYFQVKNGSHKGKLATKNNSSKSMNEYCTYVLVANQNKDSLNHDEVFEHDYSSITGDVFIYNKKEEFKW